MGGGWGGHYIPVATLSPPNDSCIKMGSDESHFHVSLIVRSKVTRHCPQTTFLKRKDRRLFPTHPSSAVLPFAHTACVCTS